jgi:hypothetical protein
VWEFSATDFLMRCGGGGGKEVLSKEIAPAKSGVAGGSGLP